MGRIRKAYETRFRWLLQLVRARKLEQGVEWLINRATRLSAENGLSPAEALADLYENLAERPAFKKRKVPLSAELFFCDAGLGGLARWLRASGYDTAWESWIDDDLLLQHARQTGATLLTTDSMLMERRVIRDRIIQAFWLPPTLHIIDELQLVFREFGLRLRPRRCMTCGGELIEHNKESLRDRIPPRTYLWRDDYFLCRRCGKLFWHGTHWRRIERELTKLTGTKSFGDRF